MVGERIAHNSHNCKLLFDAGALGRWHVQEKDPGLDTRGRRCPQGAKVQVIADEAPGVIGDDRWR